MRYRQLGNRLRFLRALDNGTLDWLHSGSYNLEGGGDEPFVIVHCSGAAVHCNIDHQLVHTNICHNVCKKNFHKSWLGQNAAIF